MSKQVTVGEFTLETSGDQIVVRDATGGIVETVDIGDLNGELMLPTGQRIDVAALMADPALEGFQTAAGGQPGVEAAPGNPNGGPSAFRAFNGESGDYSARGSAGALGNTSLDYSAPGPNATQFFEPKLEQSILVTWASHEPWEIEENQGGGVFGKVVDGNPADFTFAVSDARFEVVDGVLRVRNGYTFDFENEPGIDLQITATSRTGDVQTLKTHIDVTDVNEEQTSLTLDNAAVDENAAGAVIGNLNVADPDSDDQQSFAVSDSRFEVVNGQLKLKDGVALDHEGEGSVDVTVTATDKGGHQISQSFTIQVGDVNEAPTDIDLSGNTLVENVAGAVVGTLSAIDPDAGDSHTFEVSDSRFEVVNGALKLKDGVSIDFENEPTLNVVVTATDSGGKSVQETFTLSVEGANEGQTSLTIDNTAISENAAGAVVGTLTVMDPDAGDSQSFEVSDNRFEIVNGQLKLKDGVSLDHESEPSVSVQVTATDSAGHQIAQTFAIDVGDVNEAQTAMTLAGKAKVAENVEGAVVGAITVTDPDAGDVQSFKVSDDRFEVSNGQLKLKDGVSLNFEAETGVSVTVTATDKGGNEIAKTFNVSVTNVNEAQTSLTLSKSTVAENAKGAVIGALTVADPDAGDKQTFTVSDSRFQVVNGQLKLKSGVSIDYETEPSVDVKVTATDKGGHQISETLHINVTDVNEKQTSISLTGNTVAENDKGAVIGSVSVSDPDAGDIQSYKVSDSRFEVVDGQLKLKDGVSLNYETAATVNVKVTATDAANHVISKTFAINVGDVNEAQTNMTLTGTKVSENAEGAVVGTLKVTDPDKGDVQSFSVSDNRFEVVDGQLKLKDGVSLDYEAGSKVAVDVTATDMGGHQITKTYTVNVGNVWEAQTDMTLSASNVKENAAGATIGTLKVTDPDAGDKQTYTVSDDRFEVVNNKLKLKAGVSLDHEAAATIDLDVTATDKGGNQITKSYTVNVTDVNEAQTAITIDNNSIAENTKGAVVGTLSVADQDVGDVQSFKVSDNRFEVVNGQLKVKAGVSFDYEATPSVDVTVTATDKGKHSFAQTFTVSIADVNEAQTGMALVGKQVAENAPGAVIGIVSVTDPDAGDVQSYQVSDDRFEVTNGQLKLKDGISLDHEAEGTVSVTITATDKGGHQISQTYQIQVDDANDAQTAMSIDTSHVAENAAGAVVGTITVVDQDAGDSQSFQVSDDRFEVVNGQLKLKDGVSLDHESEGSVTVTVKATDQGGHEIAQDFKISVDDVNEAQTGLTLGNSNVVENAAGAVIGAVTVTDPDAGDVQSFQVSDARFEVVNGALKLKDGVSLDHESEGSVTVTVKATDQGGHEIAQDFKITVGDVNEAPLSLTLITDSTQLLINGSFESNKLGNGSWQLFSGIDGWNTNTQVEIQNNVTNKASDGAQVVEMDADNKVDNLYQDVKTTAGHVYELTFDTSTRGDTKHTDTIEVYWNGTKIGTVDPQSTTWQTSTFQVIGTGGDDRLEFREVGGNNDNYGGLLDNVALKGMGTTVPENFGGVVIGTLSVTDPDVGDSHSFQVSDGRFEVVDGQLKLKSDAAFNYEAEQSVSVTVTATDTGGNQIQQTFAIKVADVNEAQTALTWTGTTIAENVSGAAAGTIWVADPDAGDSQSFKVSDSRFEVVNNQLKLKSGVALDYEAGSSVNVDVTATDKAGHQITKTFAINVADVNEAQTGMTPTGAMKVSENAAGAVAGGIIVSDPDAGDKQTFSVSDNRFEVVNNTLKLKDGVSLNYEAASSVNVTVTATDMGGNQVSKTITVGVTDVNEKQTSISLFGSSIAENTTTTTSKSAVIGSVLVSDPDAGDSQTITVSDSRFQVVNNQLVLKPGVSLDYETEPTVNLTITATDKGGNQISTSAVISVTNVNEAQTGMTLSASKVTENATGAVIGTLATTDPDANDSQSYTVSDNRFEVVNNQLKLKAGVSLDYEQASSVNVTVTATDQGQNQYSKTFAIAVTNVNEVQTGMTLSASKVAENSAGATIGTLATTDPDANDTQTYTVSDSRFEVVNNALKLKSGVSVNYEAEPSVNVTVTAKDTGGNTYSKAFTIGVTDVNEAQTGMSLSASKVAENSAGATIGTLTTTDPDAGDTQSYTVSDNRFEVVNNQLQLKSGVSLDYEAGSTVNVTVTATDKGQHQYSKSFAVTVTDVNEIAPVVVAKDGHVDNHVHDTVTTYNPTASATVGSYLYSNDSAKVATPAASDLTAIDGANMTLKMETEVQVTFQKEAAGNRNMVGTYQYDDSGKIIPGSVKMVWLDASANTEGQLGSTMVKDFLGYQQSNTVSLGTMDAGTHVGFFTISNGAGDSTNRSLLTTAASGTTNQAAAMDAIESQLSIKVDANGNGHVYVGNAQMNGEVFFTHDKSLNTDFNGSSDIVHMTSGVSSSMPSQLLIGVEDLGGGGDKDFNDVVFSVNLGSYDTNKTVSNTVQPSVDFSDADSSTLTQAAIQTSGFQAGDVLTIPTSTLFNVQVTHTTAEYTITITGKTGAETIDQYENFVNSISFSTSSKVEGDRHIDYSVTDNGGLKSNVDSADISVDTDYHVSTSELSGGKTTFGDGGDHLYLNTSSFGPVDMGDGHDTVHLAQTDRGFDHNDAVKLSNVEELDTTGYGANKVSLSITDVLNMTDDDNQLTVIGDKGDSVTLESSGSGKWEVTGSDAEFTTYHYTDSSHEAIVQISNQLTAQIG